MRNRDFEALREVPLFSGLPPKALKHLAEMLRERSYPAGAEITTEGSLAEAGIFFLLDSGTAEVRRNSEVVNELGPGDCFGEMALIHKGPRTATVLATEEVQCRTLASFQFRAFAKSHGEVAWALLEQVAERLRATPS